MIPYICDNKSCENHKQISESAANDSWVKKYLGGGRMQNVERFLYRGANAKNFWLCNTCHSAVEMTKQKG